MDAKAAVADHSNNGYRRGKNRRDGGGQMNSGGPHQKWITTEGSSGSNNSRAAGVTKGDGGSGKAVVEMDGKNPVEPPSVSYDNFRPWSKVHNVDTKPNQVQGTKTNSSSKSSLGVAAGSTGGTNAEQSFIAYLPQDDAVMDASQTQEVVDLLNEQLSVLLCLPSRQFWEKVIMDESLSVFLDSYLQYRKRWFDVATGSETEAKVRIVVGDGDLSRRAFMVLLRMSLSSDPGALSSESLFPKGHAATLKERKMLDIPKLMDVSAIYGHDNPDLTRRLVSNVFRAQPGYADDLAGYVPPLLQRIMTMHQRCCDTVQMIAMHERCSDTVEALTGPGDSSTFVGANRIHQELLEIVAFLNDVVFTLNAFILVYPPAANILMTSRNPNPGPGFFLPVLATIHDTLLPNLEEGFTLLASKSQTEGAAASAKIPLNRLRERLVDLVWLLINNRYLGGSSGEDMSVAQTTYNGFDDTIAKGDSLVDEVVALAMGPNGDIAESDNFKLVCTGSLLKSMERRHGLSYQIQQACQRGLLVLDDAQQDYISAMMTDDQAAVVGHGKGFTETRHNDVPRLTWPEREKDEETVIRQSKICQVKDLFPDFGDGFVDACLEVYDNDPEKVIQRILDGSLHPDLVSLDASLAAKPARLVKPPPVKDKGKGKVNEMAETESVWEDKPISLVGASSTISVGGSSSSASAASHGEAPVSNITISDENSGRYMRRQRGVDGSFNDFLDNRTGKEDLQRAIKAAAARIEYEDEYDDSFDELGHYVPDAGGIEETESLADLVGSRGGRSIPQSRNGSRPSPVAPWGTSSSRDRQSSGNVTSGRGDSERGERQHPTRAPFLTGDYQRGEGGEREKSASAVKGSSEPSRGDRQYPVNVPRSNAEGQRGESRYSTGASHGNVEVQRGDKRYSDGAPRSEERQIGDRKYRPANELEVQKGDRQNVGGNANSPSGTSGYQFWSPVSEGERDGQVAETQGLLALGQGRGGRGGRGRGKHRGPQPKSDFYLKDGKLYSYKVAGAVGVGSVEEAEAIKRDERETIYGLGEGGNVLRPQDGNENPGKQDGSDNTNRGEGGRGRGGYGRGRGDHAGRGRGRGGNDHHRKDKAMQKHFAGLGGY